jgi:hypothetical protein
MGSMPACGDFRDMVDLAVKPRRSRRRDRRGNACFNVKDHAGMSLAYIYFEDEPGRHAAAKLLTRDEARRIAANVAKLLRDVQRFSTERPTE